MTATLRQSNQDFVTGKVIVIGAGVVVGAVLIQNISPYAQFFEVMIADGVGALPWLGAFARAAAPQLGFIVGFGGFAAIQAAEIRPLLMDRSDLNEYRLATAMGAIAYGADAVACSLFWPPITVPINQFIAAPTLSAISLSNIAIAVLTLFGLGWYVRLLQSIKPKRFRRPVQSQRSQHIPVDDSRSSKKSMKRKAKT